MINKLVEKIKKTNAPIVVGLDPMLSYVPEHIQKAAFAQFGETLEGAAEAIWQYNKAIVDATYDLIPAVKPQFSVRKRYLMSQQVLWILSPNRECWKIYVIRTMMALLY